MAKASKQDVTKIQNALTACRNLNRQVIQCRDLNVPENISLKAHGMAIIEMVELLPAVRKELQQVITKLIGGR